MGHNIRHITYPENVNRKKVQNELDTFVAHEDYQEGCSGLASPIRWIESVICNSYNEAIEKIERLDRGWYDQLAVRYYENESFTDKKIGELQKSVKELCDAYTKKNSEIPAQHFTADYVGCKSCGSKITRTFIKSNKCPVCHADMRSESTMNSIEAIKKKLEKARKALEEYTNKHAKKKVMWLVKIEYHT